ncbi:hypothetical protein [Halomonas sp. PR-M31]
MVHGYLNLDAEIVVAVVRQRQYQALIDFANAQLGK